RQKANRDVQAVGECLHFLSAAIGAEIGENLHRIAWPSAFLGGVWIFDGARDPESAAVVEREVERLVDLGLGSHELERDPAGNVKRLPLFASRSRWERRDVFDGGRLLAASAMRNGAERQQGDQGDDSLTMHHDSPKKSSSRQACAVGGSMAGG